MGLPVLPWDTFGSPAWDFDLVFPGMDLVLLAIHPIPCHKSDSDADISDAALLILLALCERNRSRKWNLPGGLGAKIYTWGFSAVHKSWHAGAGLGPRNLMLPS